MADRLAIESRFDQLRLLSDWVGELAARQQLTPALAYRLDLVLTEAVTNIIEHGGGNGNDHRWIILEYQTGDQSIEIEIRDNSKPFDPTAQAEFTPPDSLHEATPDGRGIHLIRKYTSGMHYRHDGECNILTLTLESA